MKLLRNTLIVAIWWTALSHPNPGETGTWGEICEARLQWWGFWASLVLGEQQIGPDLGGADIYSGTLLCAD